MDIDTIRNPIYHIGEEIIFYPIACFGGLFVDIINSIHWAEGWIYNGNILEKDIVRRVN